MTKDALTGEFHRIRRVQVAADLIYAISMGLMVTSICVGLLAKRSAARWTQFLHAQEQP